MNQSIEIGELAKALAQAQGEMKPAKKSSQNPFFRSTYADLTDSWEACRECASKNGLSVVQTGRTGDNEIVLITTLLHTSGQWIRGEMQMSLIIPATPEKVDKKGNKTPASPERKMNAQEIGASITYFRRYCLQAILGICAEDDDGNRASGKNQDFDYVVSSSVDPIISKSQGDELGGLISKLSPEERSHYMGYLNSTGIMNIYDLPLSGYFEFKKAIEEFLGAKK